MKTKGRAQSRNITDRRGETKNTNLRWSTLDRTIVSTNSGGALARTPSSGSAYGKQGSRKKRTGFVTGGGF